MIKIKSEILDEIKEYNHLRQIIKLEKNEYKIKMTGCKTFCKN